MDHKPKVHDVVYFGIFFINICNVISEVESTPETGIQSHLDSFF